MSTSLTSPGPTGAMTRVRFSPGWPRSRRYRPAGSSNDIWRTRAPMDDRPMLAASARVRNTSLIVRIFQTALAPVNCSLDTATSTRAMSSISPSTYTSSRLLVAHTSSVRTAPVATAPAARPASVPSTICGNTLFVPVETGTSGVSPQPRATTLFVPSPPSVTMQDTSCSFMRQAARVEPRWSSTGRMSRYSTESCSAQSRRAGSDRRAVSGITRIR